MHVFHIYTQNGVVDVSRFNVPAILSSSDEIVVLGLIDTLIEYGAWKVCACVRACANVCV